MISTDGIRAMALALPEVEERETWGRPTFRIRDKMFLTLHDDEFAAIVKATLDEQAALIAADPATFTVPTYVDRHGWLHVHLDHADPAQLEELITDGWRRTAPKRLVTAFDTHRESTRRPPATGTRADQTPTIHPVKDKQT
jgi:hypothetical protein